MSNFSDQRVHLGGSGLGTAVTRRRAQEQARPRRLKTFVWSRIPIFSCRSPLKSGIGSMKFSSEQLFSFCSSSLVLPRGGLNRMFIGIRDFHKNSTDQDVIIAMDMSEHVGFRPLTRKNEECFCTQSEALSLTIFAQIISLEKSPLNLISWPVLGSVTGGLTAPAVW